MCCRVFIAVRTSFAELVSSVSVALDRGLRCLAQYQRPEVVVAVLRFLQELTSSAHGRTAFGVSSVNGILLFRLASDALRQFGTSVGLIGRVDFLSALTRAVWVAYWCFTWPQASGCCRQRGKGRTTQRTSSS